MDNLKSQDLSSHIRVSSGTAIVLGLLKARQDVPPTTAYLLWDPGCRGSCSFCPRGEGNPDEERLSRVVWPEFSFDEVVARLTTMPGCIRRICLQTGWNPDTENVLRDLARRLKAPGMPLCVTLHPSQSALAEQLLQESADQIGIGFDAASPTTYLRHKKRPWQEDFPALCKLLEKFPGLIEIHLIYGLGDSEKTFIETMETLMMQGGAVALFALTPTRKNTAELAPPALDSWRRIQVFRHLREQGLIAINNCRFENDRLVSFGVPGRELRQILIDGTAFRTSGCGDCNRPFYNERPGGVWYNFPRPLTTAEARRAFLETGLSEG
ncbi:MAG: radical SAM protein [Candidatus Riflebacteria bacterium]|nr:radical SAM protein [Candidatus Riflebacteria bacterium]